MKPSAIIRLLAHAFRNRLKVLLVSSPGIGKSAIVQLAADLAEADLVTMHPAVSDPTDFKGLPAAIKAGTRTLAEFLPFGNLRKLVEAKSLTICFIDDIGQAPHSVQAALMQLIHAREVDGQKISEHVVFVGATNDSSHMAGVNSILEPVKSRWDTIIQMTCDVDDWVSWAIAQKHIAPAVVAFIRFRPALLNDFKPSRELRNSPCPRTVEAVGKWVATGIEDHQIIAGAAGEGFATEFGAFLQVWKSLPDIESLIANPATAPLPDLTRPSLVIATVTAIAYRATIKNLANVITYLERLPKEFEMIAIQDATARDKALMETAPYTHWTIKNQALFA